MSTVTETLAVPSARSNARWVAMSQATRLGVQVLGLIILSRILKPADFGLVAMASIVANFANMLRDLGTGAALIQKPELRDDTVLAVFWLNNALGMGLAIIVAGAAPLIASLFSAPALTPLLLLLALSFPINGLGIVQQSLLERSSRFALVARIEIVSFLSALVVAIGSAWLGAGAYSLILQTLTAATLGTVQLWFASNWRPRFAWPASELKGITGFGSNLFAFGFVNYFSRNADAMVIGRFLDAASLGAYSLAYRIMLFPLQNLTAVATRALFPVFSRQHAKPEEIASLYLRTVGVIAFITAPLMAGLFALREPFVDVVLGAKWSQVTGLIAFLAPCGFIQSIVSTTGCVFMARGRTELLFRIGLGCAVVQVASFVIGVRWGVEGVAACYLVATILCAVPALYLVMRLLGRSVGAIVTAIRLPIALAVLMCLALCYLRSLMSEHGVAMIVQLASLTVVGALLYWLASRLAAKRVEQDMWRLLSSRA